MGGVEMSEVRLAARSLRSNPGFSAVVVLTLALGIGTTTAAFSAVYGVFLRPLPYSEPDRLVRLNEGYEGATPLRPGALLSNVTFHAWRDAGMQSLVGVEGYTASDRTTFERGGGRELVRTASVTSGLFSLVGSTPVLGRTFTDADATDGSAPVVVLNERFWRARLGADPTVVGSTVSVSGRIRTVVGIAPAQFALPDRATDVWTPLTIRPATGPVTNPVFQAFVAIGRMRPGATVEQVTSEGTTIAQRREIKPLAARITFGEGGAAFVTATPIGEALTASVRSALLIVAAGIACILLVACVNAASLMLARGAARQRELTVRSALGAGRGHLARVVLAESAVLALLGGGLGLGLAFSLLRVAAVVAPPDFPRLDDIRLDMPAFFVAFAATILTAIASAIPAIMQVDGVDVTLAFRAGHTASSTRERWLRTGLLAAESGFAVLVLVTALLLGRSFVKLMSVDAGYTPDNVLIVDIFRSGTDQASAQRLAPVMAATLDRVRALPGVEAAAFGLPTPLDENTSLAAYPSARARLEGNQLLATDGSAAPTVLSRFYTVTPGFDRALGLRLRAGRFLSREDETSDVVRWVVNEEYARLHLPPNAIGRPIPWVRRGVRTQLEIVGIVGNVLKNGNRDVPQTEIYGVRRDTDPFGNPSLVVRTTPSSLGQAAAIRTLLREAAPDAFVSIEPLSQRLSESLAQPRFAASVFGAMALFATLLTTLGVLSSLSYTLARRRREFGVRTAVGATRTQLVGLVLRDGARPTVLGVMVGLLLALVMTQGLRGVVFGISTLDVVSFAIAPVILIPLALLTCLLPALRASRIDPMTALRVE
jgi:putative ABC transport system permease protein